MPSAQPGNTRHPAMMVAIGLLLLLLTSTLPTADAQPQTSTSAEETETYRLLAEALEDPRSREDLIATLRSLAENPDRDPAPATTAGTSDPDTAVTSATLEQLRAGIAALAQLSLDRQTLAALLAAIPSNAVLGPVLVVVLTLLSLRLLRRLRRPLLQRLAAARSTIDSRGGLLRFYLAVSAAVLIDAGTVLIAWLVAYALMLLVAVALTDSALFGSNLFLIALLWVEGVRLAIRRVLAPDSEGLRLLPMPAADARDWARWLDRLVAFAGYGLLVLVPLLDSLTHNAVGRVLSALILIPSGLIALRLVWRDRKGIRDRLKRLADAQTPAISSLALSALAGSWHLLASAYIVALVLVALLQPEGGLPYVAIATGISLLGILTTSVGFAVLHRLGQQRLRLSAGLRKQVPTLEERINAILGPVLTGLRGLLLLLLAGVVIDAWTPFSLLHWLFTGAGVQLTGTAASLVLIAFLATTTWLGVSSWIEHRLNPDSGRQAIGARERTLLALFRNALAIALIVLAGMVALSEIGIDIGPLIAGAGVIGLAVGFGSQKLVQDIITGVFIQLESAINTGDVVTVAGITGTAEKLTIRSIGLRDLDGTFHLIPFSSVGSVSNYMRDYGFHTGVYGIAYRDDIDLARASLEAAFEELRGLPEQAARILAPLEMHGVVELGDSAVKLRVRIKTRPGDQWGIGRLYNELVKKHFDAAGIEIPFPHTTVYFGQDSSPTTAVSTNSGGAAPIAQ